METKRCSKCGEVKELGEFHKMAASRDGHRPVCKSCRKQYHQENKEKSNEASRKWRQENKEKMKKYYQENKEKKNQYNKKWYQENKEKMKQYNKKWYQENKEKMKQYSKKWYQENKEKSNEASRKWRQENKEKKNQYAKKYYQERYQSDPVFRLAMLVRTRTREALKGIRVSSCKYLGCTWDELRDHLESQFTDGMTWDNMGEWHHDHIKPLATAKTTEDVIHLSHYTNLRPLWGSENQSRPTDGSDLTSPWPRTS